MRPQILQALNGFCSIDVTLTTPEQLQMWTMAKAHKGRARVGDRSWLHRSYGYPTQGHRLALATSQPLSRALMLATT